MDERAEFLDWFGTTWRAAETALHAGDAATRDGTWSKQAPVTLFGAYRREPAGWKVMHRHGDSGPTAP